MKQIMDLSLSLKKIEDKGCVMDFSLTIPILIGEVNTTKVKKANFELSSDDSRRCVLPPKDQISMFLAVPAPETVGKKLLASENLAFGIDDVSTLKDLVVFVTSDNERKKYIVPKVKETFLEHEKNTFHRESNKASQITNTIEKNNGDHGVLDEDVIFIKSESEDEMSVAQELQQLFAEKEKLQKSKTNVTLLKKVIRSKKVNSCDFCGKIFQTKYNFAKHLKFRYDKKKFQFCEGSITCDICGKTFLKKRGLQRHKELHSEDEFTCDIYGKVFRRKDYLRKHEQFHARKKHGKKVLTKKLLFPCTLCDKKFKKQSNLDLHLRLHAGEKPFSCNQCGTPFISKYYLHDHMKIHTGIKPHICGECGKRFLRKFNFQIHYNSMHSSKK